MGLLEVLSAIMFGSDASSKPKKHSKRCDGDCENCPPHYGYRYGRWFYGKSHSHCCERGGNKCDGRF